MQLKLAAAARVKSDHPIVVDLRDRLPDRYDLRWHSVKCFSGTIDCAQQEYPDQNSLLLGVVRVVSRELGASAGTWSEASVIGIDESRIVNYPDHFFIVALERDKLAKTIIRNVRRSFVD